MTNDNSSDGIHDRLFRTMIIGLGTVIAYTEIRVQLIIDDLNKVEDRFHEHTSQPAHEGAAASNDIIKELVFWIMRELGLDSVPATFVPTS